MTLSRRRLLNRSVLAATALTAAACSPLGRSRSAAPTPGTPATAAVPARLSDRTSVLQVLAHPDDDLYFMNPELVHLLRAGAPVTSVYLTPGESMGMGRKAPAVRAHEVPVTDRAHYAAARLYGLRRAYAQMATGRYDSPWTRGMRALSTGSVVEVDTLDEAPHVRLVFVDMLESGDKRRQFAHRTLRDLVEGSTRSVPTIVLPGAPVARSYSYTREDLLSALNDLLVEARPTLVCTLDHDSEHKPGPKGHGVRPTDHFDHTATAQFTVTAVERYQPPAGAPAPVLLSYRGYANERWPQTLDPATVRMKTGFLTTYSGRGLPCRIPTGCGDHNLDRLHPSLHRFASTQHRYQGDTGWLQTLPDGRLTAFAVLSGTLQQWTQGAPDRPAFDDPRPVPGGDSLLGQVGAVRLPDGRIRLFCLRHGGMVTRPSWQRRSVVSCVQDAPGGAFGPWEDLGGPDGTVGAKAREIGLPYAAADAHGRVYLAARAYDRALAVRTLPADGGAWTPWSRPSGPVDVQDGVCLVPRADGRLEMFAGTRTHLYQWTARGGAVGAARKLPLPAPACAPTAVELPGGRLRIFLRPPGSADLRIYDEQARGWSRPSVVSGLGGYGRIVVSPPPPGGPPPVRRMVAARNDSGTVSTFAWPGAGAATRPRPGPGLLAGTASAASGADGRTYLAFLGVDGSMNLSLLSPDGPRT